MDSPFIIKEHTFHGQHIREYPGALLSSQDDRVHVHVKQYIPKDNQNPKPNDITLIAAHANGLPKETYEPLWADLIIACNKRQLRIRSIWMPDMATQGTSGVINEDVLGNDPHWYDHSRDLLFMINHFRDQMPRPIFGLGHSVGGAQMVFLSHMHPRLFTSLVLLDPMISDKPSSKVHLLYKHEALKPDLFESREDAEKALRKSPQCRGWEERCIQKYLSMALRDTPTAQHPDPRINEVVTLRTPKHAEFSITGRTNPDARSITSETPLEQRHTHPDVDPSSPLVGPVYQHASLHAWRLLETIRPSVLFLLGRTSPYVRPGDREQRSALTGIGVGGSGGEKLGRVKTIFIDGGHFFPQSHVSNTAEEIATFLCGEWQRWLKQEETWRREWESKSERERRSIEPRTKELIKKWDGTWTPGPARSKI